MRKSLGVKKARPAAAALPTTKTLPTKSTSSQPTYSQQPTAPALFAKRQTSSPLSSDAADSLALDRLRIVSASASASSPATSPTANSLAALASSSCILPLTHRSHTHSAAASDVSVNPFALPVACPPSTSSTTSAPNTKFDFARPASRAVSKPTHSSPAITQLCLPAPVNDKRKRTLSNELHTDRLQSASNPPKRSNNTSAAALVPAMAYDHDSLTRHHNSR